MNNACENSVVITGMGALSPYGRGVGALWDGILHRAPAIHTVPALEALPMVKTKVAATVPELDYSFIPRSARRSMPRMARYAYVCAQEALLQAGYRTPPAHTGFFLGSTLNSISVWMDITRTCHDNHLELVKTSDFLQIMNHSPLATVAQALKLDGPCIGASEACATGLLNVGLAYLAIKAGLITQALCGGTEEYHPLFSACFDIMQATSHNFNHSPQEASRPFDENRTGLVVAEGCGLLFLETKQSAQARGVPVLAEIAGFASNTETDNMAYPSAAKMQACMAGALANAHVNAPDIDLLNAHATGTVVGDIAETQAANALFGPGLWVNSLKGHLGHTMGASGALELIACQKMLETQTVVPTLNLTAPDARCGQVTHVKHVCQNPLNTILKNSFAIGGNNCSLVIRRSV